MKYNIMIGEAIEQQAANQVVGDKSVQSVVSKLVNPTLVFRLPFIPGSFDMAVVVSTKDIDYSVKHTSRLSVIGVDKTKILVQTGDIVVNPNSLSKDDGLNFNAEFKKVIIEDKGEYQINFTLDNVTYSQTFNIFADKYLKEHE